MYLWCWHTWRWATWYFSTSTGFNTNWLRWYFKLLFYVCKKVRERERKTKREIVNIYFTLIQAIFPFFFWHWDGMRFEEQFKRFNYLSKNLKRIVSDSNLIITHRIANTKKKKKKTICNDVKYLNLDLWHTNCSNQRMLLHITTRQKSLHSPTTTNTKLTIYGISNVPVPFPFLHILMRKRFCLLCTSL